MARSLATHPGPAPCWLVLHVTAHRLATDLDGIVRELRAAFRLRRAR